MVSLFRLGDLFRHKVASGRVYSTVSTGLYRRSSSSSHHGRTEYCRRIQYVQLIVLFFCHKEFESGMFFSQSCNENWDALCTNCTMERDDIILHPFMDTWDADKIMKGWISRHLFPPIISQAFGKKVVSSFRVLLRNYLRRRSRGDFARFQAFLAVAVLLVSFASSRFRRAKDRKRIDPLQQKPTYDACDVRILEVSKWVSGGRCSIEYGYLRIVCSTSYLNTLGCVHSARICIAPVMNRTLHYSRVEHKKVGTRSRRSCWMDYR